MMMLARYLGALTVVVSSGLVACSSDSGPPKDGAAGSSQSEGGAGSTGNGGAAGSSQTDGGAGSAGNDGSVVDVRPADAGSDD